MVILSYNCVKRPIFTAVVIMWIIDFGNIADILTGWQYGLGEMSSIQSSKTVFAHHAVLNHRPAHMPVRIAPDALRQYQSTNNMLGPCCLCPLINPMGPNFVETMIYLTTSGMYAGEYVASCTKDDCSYLGEFCCLPTMRLVLNLIMLITSISTN